MPIAGNILTLDLATNLGWTCGKPWEVPRFGHHVLPSTGENIGRFAAAFDDWLTGKLEAERPSLVVFEAPILPVQTTPSTVRKLTGLAWHTEFVCFGRRIECAEGRASSVRKLVVGSGKAKKPDVMHVCRRYGFKVETDDEADSIALWIFTVIKRAPEHAQRFSLGPLGARAVA